MRGKVHRQRDPLKSATLTEHPILTEPGPHTGSRLIYLHGECRFSEDSVEFGHSHADSKVLLLYPCENIQQASESMRQDFRLHTSSWKVSA